MDHRQELTKVHQVGLEDEGEVVDLVEGNTVGAEHDNELEAKCIVNDRPDRTRKEGHIKAGNSSATCQPQVQISAQALQ
eukprot:673812-Amphidinium_carterae.1